jgi:hypothetical protein
MVAWPALRIPMFTCASLRFAKLSELCPAIKGLGESSSNPRTSGKKQPDLKVCARSGVLTES